MNPNAEKWVAALRSGKYKQTEGALTHVEDGEPIAHCCLGVACELYVQEHPDELLVETDYVHQRRVYDGHQTELPYKVRKWLGLRTDFGYHYTEEGIERSLADLNDDGRSFEEIAGLIETEPEKLF